MHVPGKLFQPSVIYASKAIPNGAPHSQIFDQAGAVCQGLTLGIAVSDDKKVLQRKYLIDGKFCENDVALVESRSFGVVGNVRVHQGMFPDEVENGVRKFPGVGDAFARAGFRNFG